MALQEGSGVKKSLVEAWKGIKGERLGEFGDIYRRVGVPEPISSTLGFFNLMGGLDILSKGKLVSGAKKGEVFAKSKIPKRMNKNYVLSRAKVAASGLDDLQSGLSKEYESMFNRIGDKKIDIGRVQEVIENLPKNIINRVIYESYE